jgi:hypothetical protein
MELDRTIRAAEENREAINYALFDRRDEMMVRMFNTPAAGLPALHEIDIWHGEVPQAAPPLAITSSNAALLLIAACCHWFCTGVRRVLASCSPSKF